MHVIPHCDNVYASQWRLTMEGGSVGSPEIPLYSFQLFVRVPFKIIINLEYHLKASIHGSTFVEQQVDCVMNAIIFSVKH